MAPFRTSETPAERARSLSNSINRVQRSKIVKLKLKKPQTPATFQAHHLTPIRSPPSPISYAASAISNFHTLQHATPALSQARQDHSDVLDAINDVLEATDGHRCKILVATYADLPPSLEDRKRGYNAPMFSSIAPPYLTDDEGEHYVLQHDKLADTLKLDWNASSTTASIKDRASHARLAMWKLWFNSLERWTKRNRPAVNFDSDGAATLARLQAKFQDYNNPRRAIITDTALPNRRPNATRETPSALMRQPKRAWTAIHTKSNFHARGAHVVSGWASYQPPKEELDPADV